MLDFSDKTDTKMADTKHITVVSLFSGCGGMDLGFVGNFNFLGNIILLQALKLYGQTNLTMRLARHISITSNIPFMKVILRIA